MCQRFFAPPSDQQNLADRTPVTARFSPGAFEHEPAGCCPSSAGVSERTAFDTAGVINGALFGFGERSENRSRARAPRSSTNSPIVHGAEARTRTTAGPGGHAPAGAFDALHAALVQLARHVPRARFAHGVTAAFGSRSVRHDLERSTAYGRGAASSYSGVLHANQQGYLARWPPPRTRPDQGSPTSNGEDRPPRTTRRVLVSGVRTRVRSVPGAALRRAQRNRHDGPIERRGCRSRWRNPLAWRVPKVHGAARGSGAFRGWCCWRHAVIHGLFPRTPPRLGNTPPPREGPPAEPLTSRNDSTLKSAMYVPNWETRDSGCASATYRGWARTCPREARPRGARVTRCPLATRRRDRAAPRSGRRARRAGREMIRRRRLQVTRPAGAAPAALSHPSRRGPRPRWTRARCRHV